MRRAERTGVLLRGVLSLALVITLLAALLDAPALGVAPQRDDAAAAAAAEEAERRAEEEAREAEEEAEREREEEAERERVERIAELLDDWGEVLGSLRDALEALPPEQGLLVSASRRATDSEADLSGLRTELTEAEQETAEAAELLAQARAREEAADDVLERAEDELATAEAILEQHRTLMGGHAAAIYKYGATELGAIETILRSGSPGDYLAHHKMRGSVLDHDHGIYLELAAIRQLALEERDDAHAELVSAQFHVRRRTEEHAELTQIAEAVADTVSTQSRTVTSAAGGHSSQLAKVQRLEASVTTRQSDISRIERELTQLEADNVDELEKRRRATEQAAEEERRSSYPFVDRTNFRRPLYFPSVRGLACPVEGGQFINDWAFPRPGGRTHEGTDVFAPMGTPILATTGGTVTEVNRVDSYSGNIRRGLGGRTVTVTTEDGERWYYAHLHEIAPGIAVGATVETGEQIGSVGDSGNARGGAPHLHIGRYVDRIAVNPWPALYVSCREDPET